jgi:hypothetical protein
MRYRCPVCMFASMPYPPSNYHICPCCSTEFGNDDSDFSHHQLREMWIATGANWFFGRAPEHWNPWLQLIKAGYATYVPKFVSGLFVQANTTVETAPVRNIVHEHLVLSPAA